MAKAELARLTLFIGSVALVFSWAAVIVARRLPRRRAQRPISRLEAAVLLVALLGIACVVYGFVEPYWPEVTHARITTAKLPHGSQPIRIVHLTDIHSDPRARLEGRLAEIVRAQRPDLIVFTGDSLNSPEGLPVFKPLMSRLSALAPTYAVRGNWDVGLWGNLDLFGGTGVHEFKNEGLEVTVRGQKLWIGGIAFSWPPRIGRLVAKAPPESFKLLLYHSPDEIMHAAAVHVDLMLSGHTHGGQIRLPLYGALVTFSNFGKRFEWGLHRVQDTWLYVSRGIGMEGDVPARVRFLCRPEIAVIEVAPE